MGYLGGAIACVLLVCGFWASRSIRAGFADIERQTVLQEVGWVILDAEARAVALADFANDLGVMPEVAAFVLGGDLDSLGDFLGPDAAEVMEFDFAAIFDRQGDYLAGVRYDARFDEGSVLSDVPSKVIAEKRAALELKPGRASVGVLSLDGAAYLAAYHLIYDPDEEPAMPFGCVVLGRRLSEQYEEFDGSLGTAYSVTFPRERSTWRGEGTRLQTESVYVALEPVEDEMFEDDGEIDWVDPLEEVEDVWEMVEFDVDLDLFEKTQYFLLDEAVDGPDGQPKTQVMCSLGGGWNEAEAVMRVLVPQAISRLAQGKARLVSVSLWFGVLLIIGFTVFAVREIRKRMAVETSLQEANLQLAHANGQKDRLFSIIGHDMRAPLNGMIRLSELMARAPDSFASQDVARFASNINLTGKQLHGLLENLLNWARVQTGQLPFDPIVLDLATVIRQVVSLYRPRAEEKELELDVDVSEGMTVRADSEMLKTVLRNLVSNAIKFTPMAGRVSVSASELEGSVRISVADTGRGLTPDELDRLFDLTNKATHQDGPEGEQGSGFGLLLCQEMVRRHGSELEVLSESGMGSEFSFSLTSS